jgi:hypothetical protein
MALSKCPICSSTNLRAHYQHIAPGINHQWDKIPSEGPTPTSTPHPQPCPNDAIIAVNTTYAAVYTKCPIGHQQNTWTD